MARTPTIPKITYVYHEPKTDEEKAQTDRQLQEVYSILFAAMKKRGYKIPRLAPNASKGND